MHEILCDVYGLSGIAIAFYLIVWVLLGIIPDWTRLMAKTR